MNKVALLAISLLLVGGSLLAVPGKDGAGTSAFLYVTNKGGEPVILRTFYAAEQTGVAPKMLPGRPFDDYPVAAGSTARILQKKIYQNKAIGNLMNVYTYKKVGEENVVNPLIDDVSKKTSYDITINTDGTWSVVK